MTKEYKLKFELVPDGCWGMNLRNAYPDLWKVLSKIVRERANHKCMICGATSNKLEAHEVWSYSTNGVQKLENVIAICPLCHSVIHIGRTELKGDIISAENHFMKVNDCSYSEYRLALGEATKKHKELNKISNWILDLSYIKDFK